MAWADMAQIEQQLSEALTAFDWAGTAAVCSTLITRINVALDPLPEPTAKSLLHKLRRNRCFTLMAPLAEALIRSGLRAPQLRRQYAQALIDLGLLIPAELLLQSIMQDSQGMRGEEMEARGLIGRIYKQLYVNIGDSDSPRNRTHLERALNEYLYAYRLAPQQNLWHGINVVALLERARRDRLPLQGLPDAPTLCKEILETLEAREQESTVAVPAWDVATALEALIALGRDAEAEAKALAYTSCEDADAFEFASTLRQLTDLWQLSDHQPPGSRLLPMLRAAFLRAVGATLELAPANIREEIKAVERVQDDLEKVFGAERMHTLAWYKKGLERCAAIARVERLDAKGHGTGWLVRGADFFPGRQGVLLLTNAHVVSKAPYPNALLPHQVRVNFQVLGKVVNVEAVVWSSPVGELDATFLALQGDPLDAEPLPLDEHAVVMTEPPPRMYIIGHPSGRDLEFSLQDNQLLACNDRLLHYRTPTERGSSGSPVFEPLDWRVVALHHAGNRAMDCLNGQPGTYEANEGIAIRAIQEATRNA